MDYRGDDDTKEGRRMIQALYDTFALRDEVCCLQAVQF